MKQSRRKVFELGGLVAAQPHGNQPMKKTSRLLQLIEQWSEESNPAKPINKERDKQIHQLWLWLEKPTIDWIGSRVGWLMGGGVEFDWLGVKGAESCARQPAKKANEPTPNESEMNKSIDLSDLSLRNWRIYESMKQNKERINWVCEWSPGPPAQGGAANNQLKGMNETKWSGVKWNSSQLNCGCAVMGRRPSLLPFHSINQTNKKEEKSLILISLINSLIDGIKIIL